MIKLKSWFRIKAVAESVFFTQKLKAKNLVSNTFSVNQPKCFCKFRNFRKIVQTENNPEKSKRKPVFSRLAFFANMFSLNQVLICTKNLYAFIKLKLISLIILNRSEKLLLKQQKIV